MGKFVIKKTATGFRFNLKATNGEIIAVSETYTTLQSCKKGIASVQANAPKAEIENQLEEGFETLKNPKFEVYQDKAGEFRFRLKAKNGQIIATGESYKAVKSCLNGVASVKKNAVDSEIVDAE
ncbi:MAG: YegP family protein [Clostridia bacterium]|nr:YegP family protein [Clostridia bacterium]